MLGAAKDVVPDEDVAMKRVAAIALIAGAALIAGCVERTIKITSQPSGAAVYLNDEEVGRTPTEVSFTFYGDYSVILRKEGYQTLQTHRQINAPFYQLPPLDIIADLLIPATIHDRHTWGFDLGPQQLPTNRELIERAEEFRDQALGIPASQPDIYEPAPADEMPPGAEMPPGGEMTPAGEAAQP
jgi:hypothetical protein